MKPSIITTLSLLTLVIVVDGCGFGGCCGGCRTKRAIPSVRNMCATSGGDQQSCRTQRRVMDRRWTREAIYETATLAESQHDDTMCNSEMLRAIMKHNLLSDAHTSKLAIHEAAEMKFGGHFAVICSDHNDAFAYIADSQQYCQHSHGNVTCYAFEI